jgi:uncharacterized membrane protein YphA (DoxX/SURF4 family)
MNTPIWIAQILLALAFGMAGIMKATQPKEKLAANMAWVNDFSQTQVRGIGTLEFLGAVGLILPALTGILPVLTPIAAVGLILVMIGAIFTHIRRKEYGIIVVNAVLLAIAAFIAYGRFVAVPL